MNFPHPGPSSLCSFSNQRPRGNARLCKWFIPFDGCSRIPPSQAPWGQKPSLIPFLNSVHYRGPYVERKSQRLVSSATRWKGLIRHGWFPSILSETIIRQNSFCFLFYAYSGIETLCTASYLSVNVSPLSSSLKACWNTSLLFFIPEEADVVTLDFYRGAFSKSLGGGRGWALINSKHKDMQILFFYLHIILLEKRNHKKARGRRA